MKVFIERENKTKTVRFHGSGKELLAVLKQNPETVILIKNNEVVTDDDEFCEDDEVKIISVISGG